METYSDERTRHDGLWVDDSRSAYLSGSRDGQGPSAVVYVFGIMIAMSTGSFFVIGGMLAGASGFPAVALAAAVPIAGFLWALTLSFLHRGPE